MTEKLFESDAYRRSTSARVVAITGSGIVLDRTVFYPLGGGQPGDSGWLRTGDGRSIRVTETRKGEANEILHIVEAGEHGLQTGQEVSAEIDWDRRYAHMRMHSCMHLLGSILRFGVTGGQVGAERSRLDFDTQEEIDKAEVTRALNALIEADHPVRSRWITAAELEAAPELIRTMSVRPPAGADRVRLLEIESVDLQPCGGTHVARTGEIGRVVVAKVESKGRRNKRVQVTWA
ncbi:MAG TPA: alanyl-tRNA editing protein [Steroidobacteraceae bacterium]|nr:alanyl-tRNA editing protein [Steroidobacteraceae bacterium]